MTIAGAPVEAAPLGRVSVVGNSGSGKTRLARMLAAALGVPFLELDAVFHLPDWGELPVEQFRAGVREFAAGAAWVVDGNYSVVRDVVWERADTVVWVDPPQALVMARVVRRTLRRTVTRQELWNGNREPFSNLWSLDPYRSIIAWSWTRRTEYRRRYETAMVDPAWRHLTFVRLRRAGEARRLLETARPASR